MEIYLLELIEGYDFESSSNDIEELDLGAVLCFNYTNTFEKLYETREKKVEIHYIHGEVKRDDDIESNNMVLGINEYYEGDEKDKHTNYNIYKKFTQRIINDTGFTYRDWISKMDIDRLENLDEPFPNNVYILGHSLDVSDKDAIKDLIDREGVKTTIFYHDKQQQTQQIANLVKMLGQEKFIDMINSVPQKICFVQQQPMKEIN